MNIILTIYLPMYMILDVFKDFEIETHAGIEHSFSFTSVTCR